MKRRFSKFLSLILSIVMLSGLFVFAPLTVGATQSASGGFSTSYSLTGDGFTDMVNIAMAQNEKTQGQIGYSEHWCADFVSDCAKLAGQEAAVPFNGVVQSLYNAVISAGGYQVSSPQAGDLLFFYNSGSGYGHVGIALDGSRNISGNIFYNNESPSRVKILQNGWVGYSNWIYVRPNYSSTPADTTAPTISDLQAVNVTGESFTIQCQLYDNVGVTNGWLHVWGPNGTHSSYGVAASNGLFSHTIYTSDYTGAGEYAVHVYAFDAAGNQTSSEICLQIKSDMIAPVITDITVSQITSKGYRISCKVSDNVGVTSVKFHTWGGSDYKLLDGTLKGNVATCYVKDSDFANDYGEYANHIYAYDEAGNSTSVSATSDGYIYITDEPKEIASTIYNGHRYVLYNSGKTWTEAEQWCEKNGGHLASITTENEWNNVKDLLCQLNGINTWLGAENTSGSWKWASGEAWSTTDTWYPWANGQPNCAYNAEHYLGSFGGGFYLYDSHYCQWNDFANEPIEDEVGAFVFEEGTYNISYNPNGGNGSIPSTTVQLGQRVYVSDNSFEKAGCIFDGYNLYRISDGKWYAEEEWLTEDEIKQKNYSKKLYKEGSSWRFDASWINGSSVNDSFVFYAVWKQLPLENTSTVSSTSINLGEKITLTASAEGGTAPYTYALMYKKESSATWTKIGTKYGTASTGSFKPGKGVPYDIMINVKDATGKIKSKTFKVNVIAPLKNVSTISAESVKVGQAVKLTAIAEGGTAPYTYALMYKKSTATSWSKIGTKYGTASTGSFKPGKAVPYDIMINVKDSTGKIKSKTFTLNVTQ